MLDFSALHRIIKMKKLNDELMFPEPVIFPSYVIPIRAVFSPEITGNSAISVVKKAWDFISPKNFINLHIWGVYRPSKQFIVAVTASFCQSVVCLHHQNELF